ncbi:MAG: enoyl-CoA hydratase-related protein [Novosphingobium sp.]|nr:enoyl-CoA hydratase-related protein [Novosphingobium sp.]
MYDDFETLKVTQDGKILTISFNRPEVNNATNPQMHQELERIFPLIGTDPEVHVVILTGEGKCFSAGGDINSLKASLDNQTRWIESMEEARRILFAMLDVDRPVIAKLNGHAVGLGATLALCCDIVIAKDTAKIADPHVGVGLVAGDGGSVLWPALVGHAKAKRYLLTGDAISGEEAERIGLISECAAAEELDEKVQALAQRLADGAAMAIRLTKKAINMDLRQRMDAMIEAHLGFETWSHLSNDHREALEAFLEKRPPNFTGT